MLQTHSSHVRATAPLSPLQLLELLLLQRQAAAVQATLVLAPLVLLTLLLLNIALQNAS
jgi:hypothetical protein